MNRLHEGRPADKPLPKAVIKKARPSWLLWLIPLGALGLCVWFVYRDYVASGPLLTLYFENTEGLEAGNTQVDYRGAQVGQVKTINLTEDGKRVKVTARLAGSARNLARAGSLFWIVRPELKLGSISGLRTIVSGEYVTVQPGTGAPTNVFAGVEQAPPEEQPNALLFNIHSLALDSLQEHSPIFYRGIEVGEVLGYQLADDARGVEIRARVLQQYTPLVRMDSVFWNAGGIDVRIGLFRGAEISAQSAQTLLSGGIEFATPPKFGAPATDDTVFELNEKPKEEWKNWSPSIPLHLSEQAPSNAPPAGSKLNVK